MAVRTLLTRGFLFACTLLAMSARLSAEDQIPWAEDFAIACQQAGAQGKLVLLHFYSDDCPPCVRVEKNVFSQPEVGAAIGRTCVPVKVHARKTPALVAKYRVQAWPTDVFVTPAGLELTRTVSPQSPTDYISMVNTVAISTGAGVGKSNNNGTITQVSGQTATNYMAAGAAQTAQQMQATGQQLQSGAQQAQASAQQAAQQQWLNAQAQANQYAAQANQYAAGAQAQAGQYVAGAQAQASQYAASAQTQASQYAASAQQAGQQFSQNTQQQTQAAADQAKEVINRYSQPYAQAAAAGGWQPPGFAAPAAAPAAAVAAAAAPQFAQASAPPQNPQPAAQPQPPAGGANVALASGTYPVAMEGFCPVTLAVERKWKKGQPQFGAVHRRRTFLFTSAAEQQKFLAEPDRYSPVMVGYDPVKFMQTGELVDGRATYSLTYRKQVYLFNDDTSLKSFWQNPGQFTEGLRQAMTQAESKTLR
ncbi:thioredoxin family protein [Anatilimnocola floriformis]|uniref:thioredoxin family protein n=1 Tax=Anatilimnocola floriformis TaxID=2948575 RepID=UPI0020C4026E|nr:thioredoxin fold domain-containing protein [Anatilimnocola floriformis]